MSLCCFLIAMNSSRCSWNIFFHMSFKIISGNNVEVIHLPSRESIISLLKSGTLFCPFLVFKLFYYLPWILKTLREQFGNLVLKSPHYFGASSILILPLPSSRAFGTTSVASTVLDPKSFLLDENDKRKVKIRTLCPLFYGRQSLFTNSDRQKMLTQPTHQRCLHFNPWLGRILLVTY